MSDMDVWRYLILNKISAPPYLCKVFLTEEFSLLGRLETVPCSHVGHIYRKTSPYANPNEGHLLKKNLVRLALVWLDDYAKYYFDRIGIVNPKSNHVSNNIALTMYIAL